MSLRFLPVLALGLALGLLTLPLSPRSSQASALLRVSSDVSYDVRPDIGPVHVSWQVRLDNQDPQTVQRGSGTVSFYDSMKLPVLRGSANLSARSGGGAPLPVSLEQAEDGPLVSAIVSFDRRLFFGDGYSFSLDYDLAAARDDSLLVTPYYVFLPAVAFGDESRVSISTPQDRAWEVSLEPADCPGPGPTFTCSAGSDELHLAAFAEVSRPDATVTVPLSTSLSGVAVSLTYFQGEEAWAQHLQDLVSPALPALQELYGFPYPGPPSVNISERGRQIILGYEGITSCQPQQSCDIAVSPVADDITVLHELAHLWSDIYEKRWLAEGFAEFTGRKAAQRLGPGLVQGDVDPSFQGALDLRLDDWADVTYLIAATPQQEATERAGYDRSLDFLLLLEERVGLEALQRANAELARAGLPADSRRFLDVLEEASGQSLDRPFLEWVFPESAAPLLEQRRRARDRLAALSAATQAEGLDGGVPQAIRADVAAWRFEEALLALDAAESGFQLYLGLKGRLASLRESVQPAGLSFPNTIDDAIAGWRFSELEQMLADAEAALAAYSRARDKVEQPRNLWQRLGLWGRDPEGKLGDAAAAFAAGDFAEAITSSEDAYDMVDDAARSALIRLVLLLVALATLSGALAAFWFWRRRPRSP